MNDWLAEGAVSQSVTFGRVEVWNLDFSLEGEDGGKYQFNVVENVEISLMSCFRSS